MGCARLYGPYPFQALVSGELWTRPGPVRVAGVTDGSIAEAVTLSAWRDLGLIEVVPAWRDSGWTARHRCWRNPAPAVGRLLAR